MARLDNNYALPHQQHGQEELPPLWRRRRRQQREISRIFAAAILFVVAAAAIQPAGATCVWSEDDKTMSCELRLVFCTCFYSTCLKGTANVFLQPTEERPSFTD
jgi:hypothetical protein